MRVIECNRCGQVINGADDDELTDRLADHFEERHSGDFSRDMLREYVGQSAYEAMDS